MAGRPYVQLLLLACRLISCTAKNQTDTEGCLVTEQHDHGYLLRPILV